ncbi:MAG TPA: hypothetical protein VF519_04785 [Mycobacteriales bacterium]|jgi:hypothetical protein
MRLPALLAAAATAAGLLLTAPAASAYQCPPPLENGSYTVAGRTVNACRLGPIIQCDPGPCDVVPGD